MAVDDEDKRRSVTGVPPTADGDIDADDRRQVAGIYRGIATDAPTVFDEMFAAFTSKSPGAAFTSKSPGAAFTSKSPGAAFSVN